jgi:Uma2 family endonuclease
VTSPSTEEYDRGEKLEHYRQIASLRELIVIFHGERRIELWRREGDGWERTVAGPGERVMPPSIDCAIEVDGLYAAASEPA